MPSIRSGRNWFLKTGIKNTGLIKYAKTMSDELLLPSFILLPELFWPLLFPSSSGLISNIDFSKKNVVSEEVTLAEPPPIDKATPPPPPVIPPPPVVQTIKFTPPKVVKDEEVQDEPPPTQEEMKDVQISTVTQEGNTTTDLPPENPVG
jgi:protein TonB